MARYDVTPPRVRLAVRGGSSPVLRIRALDDGTMASVELRLNGRLMRSIPGPHMRQRVWLAKGRNRVEAIARDLAGNQSITRRVLVRR